MLGINDRGLSFTWAVVMALSMAGAACGDDGTALDGGTDARVTTDAPMPRLDAPAPRDAGSDAGPTGEFGSPCTTDADCDSGTCLNLLVTVDIGTGYCSDTCSTASDCDGDPDTSYTYECLGEGDAALCVRTCMAGFGCPETDLCLNGFNLPNGAVADICLDVENDRCASNADCTAPESCIPVTDREHVNQVCFVGRDSMGEPRDLLQAGEACDPLAFVARACGTATDCPTGWSCSILAGDGRRTCRPPDSGICALACFGPGKCTGLCAADADCPTDMRCSLASLVLDDAGTAAAVDDTAVDLGLCTYAAGSRTACTAESDCATTGAGGARETCIITPSLTGTVAPICVTPYAGAALPGDTCGDDPGTPELEVSSCTCYGRRCAGACGDVGDCAAGESCDGIFIDATRTGDVCLALDACVRDVDCTGGDACLLIDTAAGYSGTCEPPIGELPNGAACRVGPGTLVSAPERCASGVCFASGRGPSEGHCANGCTSDTDCTTDQICSRLDLVTNNAGTPGDRTDDVVSTISACVYLPGSRDACTRNADCTAGEMCVPYADAAGAGQAGCTTAVAGGRATGSSCTLSTPCASTMCIESHSDPDRSFCTETCAGDTDCPTGYDCRRFTGGDVVNAQGTICLPVDDPRGEAP